MIRKFIYRNWKQRYWQKPKVGELSGAWDAPIVFEYECDANIPIEICGPKADKKAAESLNVKNIAKVPYIGCEIKTIKSNYG